MKWVLLAFLGVAAASQITEWSQDKEQSFHYTTSVLSGIPELGRQSAGLKLRTVIKAQKFPDNSIRIKFEDSKFKNFNEEVEKDERFPRAPKRDDEEREVPSSIKRQLEMAFKVVTNEGLMEKIQCEDSEPEWITNIKKAAVSQLLALSQSKLTQEREDRSQRQQEKFSESLKRFEASIVGDCETQYTITNMPEYLAKEFEEREQIPKKELCQGKDYYEVIKTKDLKSCKERPIYLQMYGASSISDGSLGSSAPFAVESSITRSIICGSPNSFVVRKTSNQHKAIMSPSGKFDTKEKIKVTSTSILSLRSVEDKTEDIPDVKSPKPRGSLIFEYPKEDSFSARSSEKSMVRESRRDEEPSEEDWYKAQVAQPDMESRPATLFPNTKTPEENKKQLARAFQTIVEIARKSPESSHSDEDVAGTVVVFTRALARLSLEDIKSLWTETEANLPEHIKESARNSFLDLVSISGTNPAVKYIIDAVKDGELMRKDAVMIVSNAIRNVKTPTEELIKELTDLLKHIADQDKRNMISTVALSLTHLVNKACIDKTSSVYDYPVKTFGKFCDEKSTVITRELIPFLAEKLSAARKTDTNQLLTYINALGNLGHDGASLHLLKVIEEGSFDSHPRSVAVYQLIKSAATNPAIYRPVILALIANQAESDEVRMAAITALPYTRPASSDLNQLAIRTWWEPSKQVCSYITSTLSTLAELPSHSRIYNTVSERAQEAVRLAKPTNSGIQTSHNIMISQFLDTLKAAVNLKLQYVTSEESVFPRNVFIKKTVDTRTHSTNNIESAVYFQGAEYLVNKMYEAYSTLLPRDDKERLNNQRDYIKRIVNVEDRTVRKPEAHFTFRSMGLQRIYSIDNRMVEDVIERIARESLEALRKEDSLSKEFNKIIDVNGHHAIIPTECGLPVHIYHQNPLVISGQAQLNMKINNMRNGEAALTMKPVVNYKQISQAGVVCPITKRFLGTGVDSSIHVALPLTAEVTVDDGQYSVIVKTPRDQESQKEKPVLEIRVKPYTTDYDLTSSSLVPISKSSDSKVIRSGNPLKEREVNLGRALGLSLKMKVETEQFADMAEFLHQLSEHKPLTLLTLPFPLKTVKNQSFKLMYNPKNSNTKDISFVFSFGHGNKQSSSDRPELITSSDVMIPRNVEEKCRKIAEEWKEREERDQERDQEKKEKKEHEMERCLRRESQSKCEEEMREQLTEKKEEKEHKCQREEMASDENEMCRREQSKHNRPSHEVESYCSKKSVMYKQKHSAFTSNKKCLRKGLEEIQDAGKAITINMQAALHGQDYNVEKKINTQVTISQNKPRSRNEDTLSKVKMSIKTPLNEKPYIWDIDAVTQVQMPINKWDKEALLVENLTSKLNIKSKFGLRNERQEELELDISVERSDEQKAYAKNSEAWKKCDSDNNKDLKLSEDCKEARQYAASLDVIKAELSLPKQVSLNPYISTLFTAAKAYYLPYLSVEDCSYNRQNSEQDNYMIVAKVAPNSKSLSLDVSVDSKKTILKDVRLSSSMKGLLPIVVKESLPIVLVKKITKSQAPSSCSVEGNRVSTFDRLIYDYTLNDCEHVLLKDCTDSPKVMVSVKKTPALHMVKVVIDGNKYELELVKASRGSRTTSGQVKVNGQIKQADRREQDQAVNFEDKDNQITMYEDGVYEIFSLKYGLTVRADSQSVEVKTFQQNLRNLACGLCGDLNDEKTADMRSAQQCVMSSPRLAAYSYMVEDGKCAGIPAQEKPIYQREAAKCVKKVVVPSKVYEIFMNVQYNAKTGQSPMKHLDLEQGQRICISVRQVKVCPHNRQPSEIVPERMPFFCVARDQRGRTLQELAQSGERIEEAGRYPIAFESTVHAPRRC